MKNTWKYAPIIDSPERQAIIPKALELAQEVFNRTDCDTTTNHYHTSWGFIDLEGRTVKELNRPCYADLLYSGRGEESALINSEFFVSTTRRPLTEKHILEYEVSFLDWLMNNSPWRHAFFTKDGKTALTEGTVYETHFPLRYVLQAAIIGRYLHEKPSLPLAWYHLSKYCNGIDSFILSIFFRWNDGIFYYNPYTDGHDFYSNIPSIEEFLAIRNENFSFFYPCSMKEDPYNYDGLMTIWSKDKRKYKDDRLNIQSFMDNLGLEQASTNGWGYKNKSYNVTEASAVKVFPNLLKTIFGE